MTLTLSKASQNRFIPGARVHVLNEHQQRSVKQLTQVMEDGSLCVLDVVGNMTASNNSSNNKYHHITRTRISPSMLKKYLPTIAVDPQHSSLTKAMQQQIETLTKNKKYNTIAAMYETGRLDPAKFNLQSTNTQSFVVDLNKAIEYYTLSYQWLFDKEFVSFLNQNTNNAKNNNNINNNNNGHTSKLTKNQFLSKYKIEIVESCIAGGELGNIYLKYFEDYIQSKKYFDNTMEKISQILSVTNNMLIMLRYNHKLENVMFDCGYEMIISCMNNINIWNDENSEKIRLQLCYYCNKCLECLKGNKKETKQYYYQERKLRPYLAIILLEQAIYNKRQNYQDILNLLEQVPYDKNFGETKEEYQQLENMENQIEALCYLIGIGNKVSNKYTKDCMKKWIDNHEKQVDLDSLIIKNDWGKSDRVDKSPYSWKLKYTKPTIASRLSKLCLEITSFSIPNDINLWDDTVNLVKVEKGFDCQHPLKKGSICQVLEDLICLKGNDNDKDKDNYNYNCNYNAYDLICIKSYVNIIEFQLFNYNCNKNDNYNYNYNNGDKIAISIPVEKVTVDCLLINLLIGIKLFDIWDDWGSKKLGLNAYGKNTSFKFPKFKSFLFEKCFKHPSVVQAWSMMQSQLKLNENENDNVNQFEFPCYLLWIIQWQYGFFGQRYKILLNINENMFQSIVDLILEYELAITVTPEVVLAPIVIVEEQPEKNSKPKPKSNLGFVNKLFN